MTFDPGFARDESVNPFANVGVVISGGDDCYVGLPNC